MSTQTLLTLAAVQKLRRERRERTAETRSLRDALTPEAVRALVAATVAEDPERFAGKPGREPTAAEIGAAVAAYLTPRLESMRGGVGPAPSKAQLVALIDDIIRANPERFRGPEGDDGRGIASLRINHAGHLVVAWTDGTSTNLGRVVGKDAETKKAERMIFAGGGGGLTREEVLALIEENAGMQFDDYAEVEYLDDQDADGGELVFTFSAPVQFVVIEMISKLDQDADAALIESLEGRVTTGAQAPAANVGAILKHEVPVTLLTTTDTVRVLPAANTRVTVYGKRRPIA